MRSLVKVQPHDLAVMAALGGIAGGHPVGFAAAPPGAVEAALEGTGPDYMILYPLNGSTRDGTLGDPYTDIDLNYQISCIGYEANGVRWLVDQLEAALLGVTITGRAILQVEPTDAGTVRLDTDVRPDLDGPGLFLATPRYRISTTPA